MLNSLKLILFSMLAIFASSLFSHPAKLDPTQPIQIKSDTASVEQLSHQATYSGNVIMTQSSHELHADTITVKKDPKGHLTVITAIGNPATFTGKRVDDPEPLVATAKTIYYYPDKQLVVLEGLATLEHQKDKFQGPTLSYNLNKQVISATSQNQERPTVTLYPRG